MDGYNTPPNPKSPPSQNLEMAFVPRICKIPSPGIILSLYVKLLPYLLEVASSTRVDFCRDAVRKLLLSVRCQKSKVRAGQ